jgi:hypothetical protein
VGGVSRRWEYPQKWTSASDFFGRTHPFRHSGVVGGGRKIANEPFHLQTLVICQLGFNQKSFTFILKFLIKIVL